MERRKRPLLLAFCIPVAIMLAAVIYRQIYPFGDRCFLRVDMYNQYMPFFTELHRKLREGGSLFFSWRAGLGANFLALYAYYLASPANWLLYFCPQQFLIEFMTALVIIKIGLCGWSFAFYLKRHFRTDRYAISLFAVFYALSGFLSAYNWNIMWLDCIALAPIVIFGLEELVYRKKPIPYCLTLGLSIVSNYYISMLLCLFLILYYCILALPLPLREKAASLRDFVLYSLLAGGLSGVLLLPAMLALRGTRFDQANFPSQIKMYFSFLEIAARHCVNVSAEIRNDHWPNIYCGAAVFFLIPLYICCRQVRWRDKLPRLLLLLFFYLSFSVNLLEFLWHGLNFPNSLPARQSFLYIFVVLVMSFEAFWHIREFTGYQIALTAVGAAGFIILCSVRTGNRDFTAWSFLFTIVYLFLYAALFYLYGRGSLPKNAVVIFVSALVISEAAMNTIETSVPTTSRSRYRADYEANRALTASIEEEAAPFYRVEEIGRMTKNDGMLGGFHSATLFSSTTSESVSHLYKRMGMSTSKVFYCYDGATPLASALLATGYVIAGSAELGDDFRKPAGAYAGKYLYENRDRLPLGFVVAPGLEEKWDMETGSPAEVQNGLARALGIDEPLFHREAVVCEDGEASVAPQESGYYYLYPEKCSTKNITAVTDEWERVYEKVYYSRFLDIGWCSRGDVVKLTQSGEKRNDRNELELSAYRFDLGVFREMMRRLGRQPMKVEAISDTYVRGVVETGEAGLLVTSIPNEAGWRMTIDGSPAEIKPFGKALIGAELTAGRHTIVLSYTPPGLYAGLAVSVVSAAIVALCCRKRRTAQREAQ